MRELNTLLSSDRNINCLFFFATPKTRRGIVSLYVSANSFEIASRTDAARAVLYTRIYVPLRSQKVRGDGNRGGVGKPGIVPSDMALLNFSLSGERSRIMRWTNAL